MIVTKNIKLTLLFFAFLGSTAIYSNECKCNNLDRFKLTLAEIGKKHPYIPGIICGLSLTLTKCFKNNPLQKLAAIGITTIGCTIACQSIGEYYLNSSQCYDWVPWVPEQESFYQTQIRKFKSLANNYAAKLKDFFEK